MLLQKRRFIALLCIICIACSFFSWPGAALGLPASQSIKLSPGQAKRILHDGAILDIGANAVASATAISATSLGPESLPPLPDGMVNVTKGPRRGYRFLPHMTFQSSFRISLPYDAALLPLGYSAQDIRTYYFNEATASWEALDLVAVQPDTQLVTSLTNHFTDMINAVATAPEQTQPLAENPNQLKETKPARPDAGITLIEPPKVDHTGDAALNYPIELPAARGRVQPHVSLTYQSSGANGWLGLGWNLALPTIMVDVRWGVPRYDAAAETETYLMDGAQLTPLAHRDTPVPRSAERRFDRRVEGEFDRIIRHGSHPANYWWEVTDQQGTRYLYGDDPSGTSGAYTLRDAAGNIFSWALREVRDLNGNAALYQYATVTDAGVNGGTVPGVQLYPQSIRYTQGEGDPGAYRVTFVRDRELPGFARRPDVSIDARGGFKMVTADLLKRVEVRFQQELIRSYDFEYQRGAFNKTLLTSITQRGEDGSTFYAHQFTYHAPALGFDAPTQWNTQDDAVATPLIDLSIPEVGLNSEATALSGAITTGGGAHLYLGFNPTEPTKQNSVGGKVGFNYSESEGVLQLIDLNGDGLPDKLFKGKDGNFWIRLNQSGPHGTTTFGPALALPTLPAISKDHSVTLSLGAEAYPSEGEISLNQAETFSIGAIYFADVNGDGLPDLVSYGNVLFNHLDDQGVPTFGANSAVTAVAVASASADAQAVGVDFEAIYQKQIDGSPLHDTLRRWVAPYDGTIRITGSVALVESQTPERRQYQTADGVRVAIQHNGEERWAERIEATDYSPKSPTGVDAIAVHAGDRIYFRVQSVFDGNFDEVSWDPEISYVGAVAAPDANGLHPYRYKASEDFILAGPPGISARMPMNGTIRLTGNLQKLGTTTDDVTVVVAKNNTPLLSRRLTWETVGEVELDLALTVAKQDALSLHIITDSPIDLRQIAWSPALTYTAVTDLDGNGNPIAVQDATGKYLITQSLSYDVSLYSIRTPALPQAPWVAPQTGQWRITPEVTAAPTSNGQLIFTVKRAGELLAKQAITIVNGLADRQPISLAVQQDDALFFDYSTADAALAAHLSDLGAAVAYNDPSAPGTPPLRIAGTLHYPAPAAGLFAIPYRGWGYAGYDGNRERATHPIDEALLVSPADLLGSRCSSLQITNPADIPPECGPGSIKAHMYAPVAADGAWKGPVKQASIGRDRMSSARLGALYIESLQSAPLSSASAASFAGTHAVIRFGLTSQTALSGGVGGLGGSVSTGLSMSELDYLDLNGDGFPDIVGPWLVQYTTPLGGLESRIRAQDDASVRFSNDLALSASLGTSGNPVTTKGGSQGPTGANGKSAPKGSTTTKQMAQLGLSGSLGGGHSETASDLIDMNGDGLPDRVTHSGGPLLVALNLGYRFAPPEPWGEAAINESASREYSLGISPSYNAGRYDFAGGVSVSKTESRAACRVLNPLDGSCLVDAGYTLLDLNGDGLPDRVRPGRGSLRVAFNNGNGFDAERAWSGALSDAVAVDGATTMGAGLYVTIGIGPLCIKACYLIINPGGDVSQGLARQEVTLADIDGDGYPDHLKSSSDAVITVARNRTGQSNLLKSVSRPLGASFTLDYERDGNTPDQPHSRWVLAKVSVDDGHAGDGADRTTTTYRYAGGVYDRLEREFYGYGQVIEEERDAAHGDALYRTTTRQYRTDGFYTRGLLTRELLADGNGQPYRESRYTYALRDVASGGLLGDAQSETATALAERIRVDRLFYEGLSTPGKSTYVTYAYDALGHVVRTVDAGEPGAEDDRLTDTSYVQCPDTYVHDGITRQTVSDASGARLKQTDATIDCQTGNRVQIRLAVDSQQTAVTDLVYGAYGNLQQMTGAANARGERYQTFYSYDPVVHTYVVQTRDSFGYESAATYAFKYGEVASTTDLNGNQTSYTYDGFGRLSSIVGPYEQGGLNPSLRYLYHPEADVPYALTLRFDPLSNPADPIESALFIDGLGRVVQEKRDATIHTGPDTPPQDRMIVSGRVVYDLAGRVIEQYAPTTEPLGSAGRFHTAVDSIPPTRTSYDPLDRVTERIEPDQTRTRNVYTFGLDRSGAMQFETVTIDANGNAKNRFYNVRERMTGLQEFNSGAAAVIWTSYRYDGLDRLVQMIDDQQHITTTAYDLLGSRIRIESPDAGVTEFRYDPAGNMVARITPQLRASGGAIRYAHEYNRLVAVTYPQFPENNLQYRYGGPGAPANGAGRIIGITDQVGTEAFEYGKMGESIKTTRTVIPDAPGKPPATYTTEQRYDSWGRLQSLTYPDGEALTYRYDSGGLLREITGAKAGNTYRYLNRQEYDQYGQIIFTEVGNGVRSSYTFDAVTRDLIRLQSGSKQSDPLQNLSYRYDNMRNLLSVTNDVPVGRLATYNGPSVQQFVYDDLYRLTQATGSYQMAPNKSRRYSLRMTYDTLHNITAKSQTDEIIQPSGTVLPQQKSSYDWRYSYSGTQPNAPSQIGTERLGYDAGGNLLGWNDVQNATRRSITWDEENRMQQLVDNGHAMRYKYDSTGMRVMKQGPQGEVLYVNPYFTVRNGQTGIKHIFAGTRRISSKLVKQPWVGQTANQTGTLEKDQYFYHPDRLGNSQYVTDIDAKPYEHLEYFAFGEVWVQEATDTQRTPYLFSGKEYDEETGLSYFGARYYDPRTSLWSSTDPIMPKYLDGAPNGGVYSSFNNNLYAYAYQNPTTYIDPDGQRPTTPQRRAAANIAKQEADNLAADWSQYQDHPTMVSVAVNASNGRWYYSGSGQRPRRSDIHPHLQQHLTLPTREHWRVTNCAEFNAINHALNDGAQLDDLVVYTVRVSNSQPAPRCRNCQITSSGVAAVPSDPGYQP